MGNAISDYREFRPPAALAEYLLCFWTQTIHPFSEFTQRVLSDCCVDILLMNGVPVVIGPWTEPFDANLPPGTNILGARCHPGLASTLLGVPASELLNLSVPLFDLWGNSEAAGFTRIPDEVTVTAQISAMQTALIARIAKTGPIDNAIRAMRSSRSHRFVFRLDFARLGGRELRRGTNLVTVRMHLIFNSLPNREPYPKL
jgi:hypothetical protein